MADKVNRLVIVGSRMADLTRKGGGWRPPLSLEETVEYINRYLQQDYGDHVAVQYVDVDSPDLKQHPRLKQALDEGLELPLVEAGDRVKTPGSISFSWIINEFRLLGALE